MNAEQIRAAILSDPLLRALVESGDDQTLADALSKIAPRIQTGELCTERTIFAALGPAMADSVMIKLESFASSGRPGASMMARGLKWLAPAEGGVDFQHPDLKAMLNGLVADGVLTEDEFLELMKLGTRPDAITVDDVAEALAVWRPDGIVQQIPEGVF